MATYSTLIDYKCYSIFCRLNRDEFENWLRTKPSEDDVGRAYPQQYDPIEEYLVQIGGVARAETLLTEYRGYHNKLRIFPTLTRVQDFDLPLWAIDFLIETRQCGTPRITASMALSFMEKIDL